MASMVIVIFVLTLVIKLWIVDSMEEEGLEAPMTRSDVGHAIKSDMLLPHVTHWDATLAVGLETKPMNVLVKEVKQEEVLHTHQQEDLKIRRQMSTVRDTFKHGEMKLIKEVLEVRIAQSDVGHATMLVTLLHIVVRWGVIVAVALGTKLKIVGVHGNNPWEVT